MAAAQPSDPAALARLASVRYAEASYWNDRYKAHSCEFDWFYGYTALRKLVRATMRRNKGVLHIGCGNSNFQEGLARDGYKVINVSCIGAQTDISDVVVEQMKERHKDLPNLTYIVSDCRDMPEFMDCQFGGAIDKGTVDALLCSVQAADNIYRMFMETSRVLCPGGTFLLITLGAPAQRVPLLICKEFGWTVQVMLVPRVGSDQMQRDPSRALEPNDTVRPLNYIGPLDVLQDHSVAGLPQPFDPFGYFYAYVCKKHPLTLPLDGRSRVKMPAGWTATARTVAGALSQELGLARGLMDKGRRVRVLSMEAFQALQRSNSGDSLASLGGHSAEQDRQNNQESKHQQNGDDATRPLEQHVAARVELTIQESVLAAEERGYGAQAAGSDLWVTRSGCSVCGGCGGAPARATSATTAVETAGDGSSDERDAEPFALVPYPERRSLEADREFDCQGVVDQMQAALRLARESTDQLDGVDDVVRVVRCSMAGRESISMSGLLDQLALHGGGGLSAGRRRSSASAGLAELLEWQRRASLQGDQLP